jgi:RNA polymerase sigma factor (sigma-70 family)
MINEFDKFYHENALYALRLACKFVPREKAEDVVQNVFFEIWRRWDRIENRSSYLRNSVKYRCFDEIKRITTEPIEGVELEDFKEIDIKAERLDVVASYLNRLKPADRQMIEYVIYGYSNKEIARALNLSEQTVKNKKSIAISTLKKII